MMQIHNILPVWQSIIVEGWEERRKEEGRVGSYSTAQKAPAFPCVKHKGRKERKGDSTM